MPMLSEAEHCPAEPPCLTKDGHMAIANQPDGLPSTAALGRHVLGLSRPSRAAPAERQQASWRCPGGGHKKVALYRNPALPVYASASPGGSAVSVQKYRDDTRDWRKLSPEDVARYFAETEAALRDNVLYNIPAGIRTKPEHAQPSEALKELEGLVSAVVVGTLQACNEKSYWAPSYVDWSRNTVVNDVRSPMSRVITAMPDVSMVEPQGDGTPQLKICADTSPLQACQELASANGRRRIALVRFSPAGDRRSLMPGFTDHREAQLFMQTTYLQALMDMPKHLHGDPVEALDAGSLIYTTDVALLRGPLRDGAPWLAQAPILDVLWVTLQRTPKCDDQGQYARIHEKAMVTSTIDFIFACAATAGADALVFPPPGVGGAASCRHPAEDVGDLLRKAVVEHAKIMPQVYVCQEYPGQLHSAWTPFAAALGHFREPIEHRELVPLVASPYIRPGWEPKKRKGTGRSNSRFHSLRPLASARSEAAAVLGSAGRSIAC